MPTAGGEPDEDSCTQVFVIKDIRPKYMCNTRMNRDLESLLQGSQGSDNSFLYGDVPQADMDFIMDIEV